MTAQERVKLVWPQAMRKVRGGIISPGIWRKSRPDGELPWGDVGGGGIVLIEWSRQTKAYISELMPK